jgi:hypothetical protein
MLLSNYAYFHPPKVSPTLLNPNLAVSDNVGTRTVVIMVRRTRVSVMFCNWTNEMSTSSTHTYMNTNTRVEDELKTEVCILEVPKYLHKFFKFSLFRMEL